MRSFREGNPLFGLFWCVKKHFKDHWAPEWPSTSELTLYSLSLSSNLIIVSEILLKTVKSIKTICHYLTETYQYKTSSGLKISWLYANLYHGSAVHFSTIIIYLITWECTRSDIMFPGRACSQTPLIFLCAKAHWWWPLLPTSSLINHDLSNPGQNPAIYKNGNYKCLWVQRRTC